MSSVAIPRHADYSKNAKKAGEYEPCLCCGKAIKSANVKFITLNTNSEAVMPDTPNNIGGFPIGNCCLRQHPELKPFAR